MAQEDHVDEAFLANISEFLAPLASTDEEPMKAAIKLEPFSASHQQLLAETEALLSTFDGPPPTFKHNTSTGSQCCLEQLPNK
ncbi:unnamed protein product [Phytophthora lilii]|uniref:Unnamed protein product n=1 Tax=Phytophthora lilii TaxID=2077276 RepID=A0A9W6TMI7_9STRA|nr:unnamed protein product [Phytophthora lilii]